MYKIVNIFLTPYDLGVVAFVDYKIDNDRSGSCITQCLINLGAKVEKSFNQKVITYMISIIISIIMLKQFLGYPCDVL